MSIWLIVLWVLAGIVLVPIALWLLFVLVMALWFLGMFVAVRFFGMSLVPPSSAIVTSGVADHSDSGGEL